MGPLLIGIVLLLLAFLLPVPYVLYLIFLVGGIILVVYGLFVLFAGTGPSRYTRWR